MLAPWTQSIRLTWRPELRFYEKRVEILQSFEEQGVLRAFRVQENFVDARLFESRDQLSVRQSGIDLSLEGQEANPTRAWEAAKTALSIISPSRPRTATVAFQHVVPLDLDFYEAVRRGYGQVLGRLGTPSIRFGDWALLADLVMNDSDEASGQIECGIVRRDEVSDRIERSAGRILPHRDRGGGSQRWRPEDFAEVGLFSDCNLTRSMDNAERLADDALEFWNLARVEADRLVEGLGKMILDADTHEEMTKR